MDQQKRLLLAIALSFGLTLLFTNFVWKPQAEAEAARLAALDAGLVLLADGGTVPLDKPVLAAATPPAPTLDADGGGLPVPAPVAEVPLKLVTAERATTKMTFTSEGAGLTDAVLQGKREHVLRQLSIAEGYAKLFGKDFPQGPQFDLAEPIPGGLPQLAVSITGATPLSGTQRYAVTEESPGKLVFTATTGAYEVVKTFRWNVAAPGEKSPAGYLSTLDVQVKNVSNVAVGGELLVHAVRAIDPTQEQGPSMFGGIGNQASVLCRVADDIKRKVPPAEGNGFLGLGSGPVYDLEGKGLVHYVGIDQQYFLTAVWPKEGAIESRCLLNATGTSRTASLALPLVLQPGQTLARSFGVYLGPKDLSLLLDIGKSPPEAPATTVFDPGLDKTVDFGIWAVICKALIVFLRFFHGVVGNWGIAIVLLTVMVKVVLLPLTHRAMVSAEQMKKLQPKMEEIKKKFPDDREKQNLEVMKLYQEAKVNPLGGCLPLLLQLPIWGALFTTLRTSYELYGEPFYGVWSDLTSKDPTYLFPLALGITMIVTQRLQPQMSMDKSQQMLMTWVMPVFFTAVMMNYPAGLALYIFTNNLLSIVQQYALRRWLARGNAGTGAVVAK